MFVRGLCVLVLLSAATCVAAPVPKSLKSRIKVDTARFKVTCKNKPFSQLLEEFAEETGLKWVGECPGLGKITLNLSKEYPIAEYLDLLNELLEDEQFMLVRHADTFYLHPIDQPVDPEKVDTVSEGEIALPRKRVAPPADPLNAGGPLWEWQSGMWVAVVPVAPMKQTQPKRGKSEVATLVIELPGNLQLADVRPQLVKALTISGRLKADESGREIRVTDRVDNLRFVARILGEWK